MSIWARLKHPKTHLLTSSHSLSLMLTPSLTYMILCIDISAQCKQALTQDGMSSAGSEQQSSAAVLRVRQVIIIMRTEVA